MLYFFFFSRINLILPKMFIFYCNFSFRRSIEAIHGYEDKVRIVLNKADQVDHQELMRVYGALMWSIAKVRKYKLIYRNVVLLPWKRIYSELYYDCMQFQVINVPECPKVYVGSFWDQQLKHDLYRRLFERELQGMRNEILVNITPF